MEAKQVLVMRKMEKGCRTGKYCAQAGHAAVGALLSMGKIDEYGDNLIIPLHNHFVKTWITGNFKKITVYVETDEDLVSIYSAAKKVGLPASLIKDSGLTEFNGVPTLTAVGIGPGSTEEIDKITGHLPLF